MAKEKSEKQIPAVNDDEQVKAAQQKLLDVQARFEKASHYPLMDDTAERARSILDNKPHKPRREADEISILKEAARMALERLQEAQMAAAAKIIAEITPQYLKVRSELLTECLHFKEVLDIHDDFIQRLWAAGLGNFLPASWSKKAPVVQIYPHGRLDNLIENLKIAT